MGYQAVLVCQLRLGRAPGQFEVRHHIYQLVEADELLDLHSCTQLSRRSRCLSSQHVSMLVSLTSRVLLISVLTSYVRL